MESKIIKQDFQKLQDFLKQLSSSGDYVVRVGIMGNKNARADMTAAVPLNADRKKLVTFKGKKYAASSGLTNADIGFIHEFGRPTSKPPIPDRSFLRMPILSKSEKIIEEVQAWIKAKKEKFTIRQLLTQLGLSAERQVLDAFETHGFGTWESNKPRTIARKRSNSPLIDTGQLRRSIDSEVVTR